MRHIMWKPDPTYTTANRVETAVVGDYELLAIDQPSRAHKAAFITWELFGPPDRLDLIGWGEANTFDEAKTKAENAFAAIKKD